MRVIWTRAAKRNLDAVREFIAGDNPGAADESVMRVIETVGLLADNPSMGRPGRVKGTRELVVTGTPFIVPYRSRDGVVEVLRVFHHAMVWPEKL